MKRRGFFGVLVGLSVAPFLGCFRGNVKDCPQWKWIWIEGNNGMEYRNCKTGDIGWVWEETYRNPDSTQVLRIARYYDVNPKTTVEVWVRGTSQRVWSCYPEVKSINPQDIPYQKPF